MRDALRILGWREDELVCIHPGSMGLANGLDALLDCGKVLDQAGIQNIHIALVGKGSMKTHLEARVRDERIQSVTVYDPVLRKEMPALLSAADVGVVTVREKAGLEANSANKFFDFLAAGLPVVINYSGWQSQVLRESAAGIAVPPGEAGGLAGALVYLRDNPAAREEMGRAARRLAEARYDREKLVGGIEGVLQRATAIAIGGRRRWSSSC